MKDVDGTGSDRHVGALTACRFTHFNTVGEKKTCVISSSLRPEMHNIKKELGLFLNYI